MNSKRRHFTIAVGLGLGLTLALAWALSGQVHIARADPGILYVALDGADSQPCDSVANRCRTLQRAIDVALPLDEIRVAMGTYTSTAGTVATITKTVALLGGWDITFSARDPGVYRTTLDAQRNGRVVLISGYVSPTVDGFTITGGNANNEANQAGHGGGILSVFANPVIANNIITGNVGGISPTFGHGGGIYLSFAPATAIISGNQIVSNTACVNAFGSGGALSLWASDATIINNLILSNTGSYYGGGIYVGLGAPHILNNEVRGNVAGRNSGGIHLADSTSLIEDNLIIGNRAGWDGSSWNGGAMLVDYGSPTIVANRIFSNSAGSGGGIGLETEDYFTVTNNIFAHNNATGIHLWELTRYGLIAHNTIVFNGGQGGIRLNYPHITPTIVNNIVVSNTFGISAHTDASGTLDYNDVWGNTNQDYDLPGALEPGSNDIQANPLFVNAGGDDYHLRAGSPCIGGATVTVVAKDIDGQSRVGDPDIGADEFIAYIHLPLVLRNY